MTNQEIQQVIMQVCSIFKTEQKPNRTESFKAGNGARELMERLKQGQRPKQKTYDYLNSLDFEVIQMLQTIMYIGRDCYDIDDTVDVYAVKRTELDRRGWKTKSIEIGQMTQKSQLVKYLMDGWERVKRRPLA